MFVFSLLLITFCMAIRDLSVINNDDRIINENSIITKNIGAIGVGIFNEGKWFISGTFCSATLIDNQYIYTASHCLQESNFSTGSILYNNIIFIPNYPNDVFIYFPSKYLRSKNYPSFPNNLNIGNDWAILLLDNKINLPFNNNIKIDKLPILPYSGRSNNGFISAAGYASDIQNGNILSIHNKCVITKKYSDDTIANNCDMNPGSSGGPIYETNGNNYILYAIISGHIALPEDQCNRFGCKTNKITNFAVPIYDASVKLDNYLKGNIDDDVEIIDLKFDKDINVINIIDDEINIIINDSMAIIDDNNSQKNNINIFLLLSLLTISLR